MTNSPKSNSELWMTCDQCSGSGQVSNDKAKALQFKSLPCDKCELRRVVPVEPFVLPPRTPFDSGDHRPPIDRPPLITEMREIAENEHAQHSLYAEDLLLEAADLIELLLARLGVGSERYLVINKSQSKMIGFPNAHAAAVMPTGLCQDVLDLNPDQLIVMKDSISKELHRRDCCEHGVMLGSWCEPCNKEYKRAAVAAILDEE